MRLPLFWLREFVDAPDRVGEVADLLTAIGLECEEELEVGGDTVLELATPSNRTDVLSIYGLAREVAAKTGAPLLGLGLARLPAVEGGAVAVELADGRCPRYLGLPVRLEAGGDEGVERRLAAMGRNPVSPVVDLSNVVLFETGQPLHLFTREKVAGGILVRDAKKGERMVGLDGEEHALAPGDLLITSGGEPVALAGVLGAAGSGSAEADSRFLLESATFDFACVRRSAQRLGLATDSSYRFERGVDPAGWEVGARRFLWWCERLGWGGADGPAVLAGAAAPPRGPIPLPPGEAKRRLGLEIADEEAAAILESLGFGQGGGGWLAPSWRLDVAITEDLLEEIVRLHGYDNLPETITHSADEAASPGAEYAAVEAIVDCLVDAGGMQEFRTSIVAKEAAALGAALAGQGDAVAVTNPSSRQRAALRGALLPGLEAGYLGASRRGVVPGWTFEVGRRFSSGGEESAMAVWLPVEVAASDWAAPPAPGTAGQVKGLFAAVAGIWGQELAWRPDGEAPWFLPGTAWRFVGAGMEGVMGARQLEVGSRREVAWAGEARLEHGREGLCWPPPEPQGPEPSRHPDLTRDMTVRAGPEDDLAHLAEVVAAAVAPPLRRATLVARYKDKETWALTWRLVIGAGRTLEEAEIAAAVERVRESVAKAGYTLG